MGRIKTHPLEHAGRFESFPVNSMTCREL
jgi:hypothetical protein